MLLKKKILEATQVQHRFIYYTFYLSCVCFFSFCILLINDHRSEEFTTLCVAHTHHESKPPQKKKKKKSRKETKRNQSFKLISH